eukprot:1605853-Rhodomonas_salina.5
MKPLDDVQCDIPRHSSSTVTVLDDDSDSDDGSSSSTTREGLTGSSTTMTALQAHKLLQVLYSSFKFQLLSLRVSSSQARSGSDSPSPESTGRPGGPGLVTVVLNLNLTCSLFLPP